MKKIFLTLFCLIILTVNAESLKGGIVEEYIPQGFFGSWGVISKLKSATNPSKFNYESKDIWMLSGSGNILILQNLQSGAYSEIEIKEKSYEGKTLKFERKKTLKTKEGSELHKETVKFIISGNNFSGTDDYSVEYYDKNNNFTKGDCATYSIEGVRISGN